MDSIDQLQVSAKFPSIASENLQQFKDLVSQALEITKGESGTLQYDFFFNADEAVCAVREKYDSSEAVLTHLGNLGELFGQMVGIGGFEVEVFGTPSAQLMEAAGAMGPTIYTYFTGL